MLLLNAFLCIYAFRADGQSGPSAIGWSRERSFERSLEQPTGGESGPSATDWSRERCFERSLEQPTGGQSGSSATVAQVLFCAMTQSRRRRRVYWSSEPCVGWCLCCRRVCIQALHCWHYGRHSSYYYVYYFHTCGDAWYLCCNDGSLPLDPI